MAPYIVIAGLMLMSAPAALGHPVIVDGDPADWMSLQEVDDLGHIRRDSQRGGEYVWMDRLGDERTDFANPDQRIDLREFRVTSTATHLYLLIRFRVGDVLSGDGAPMVQVAIDEDRVVGSGVVWLGGFSDTQVSDLAAWERLIVTRFGSGSPTPAVYDPTWSDLATPGGAVEVISTEALEIVVPWTDLGFSEGTTPVSPLRFTVACFRSTIGDETWDVAGQSDALDAVTNYGDPGTVANTWAEVADGIVDYHVDVWVHLDADTEPASPLLISEALYNPTGTEPANEWLEIFNVSGQWLDISDFMLGDEETVDGSEGMAAFPSGAGIALHDAIVIAQNGAAFEDTYGFPADFELSDASPLPDMIPATTWATGSIALANGGDQVLLLDPFYTVLDVLAYGSGTYPDIVPAAGVAEGSSLARSDARIDTDDCSADFSELTTPTPGSAETLTSVPLPGGQAALRLFQNAPNPFNPQTIIRYELAGASWVRLDIYDLGGRHIRTLVNHQQPPGKYSVVWGGQDGAGAAVGSGTYLYCLEAEGFSSTKKMLLLR